MEALAAVLAAKDFAGYAIAAFAILWGFTQARRAVKAEDALNDYLKERLNKYESDV